MTMTSTQPTGSSTEHQPARSRPPAPEYDRAGPRPSDESDQVLRAALAAAAAAVALVAGLTAWAAWRFDRNWPLAVAPWIVILGGLLAATLVWLRTAGDAGGEPQPPGGLGRSADHDPGSVPGLLDRVGVGFGRGVPLARRNLFADRRRALLATGGVAVALLLVLLLAGMVDGAMRQLTGYIDDSGADLVISQQGVRTMHMSASVLPPDIADRVRHTPGVAWAEPIRYTTAMVSSPAGRSATYVIGYDPTRGPGRDGGPAELVAGRPPRPGEAVIDQQAADQLDVRVGGQVRVLGEAFTVAGLSTGGTNIANTTVFLPTADLARLRGPAQAYVLVAARPGTDLGALRWQLAGLVPGPTVQTAEQFAEQERRLVGDMSADVMRIMSGIGFAIALAVIALSLFAVTVAKQREYGVVKALGARPGRLAATVAAQAAWTVSLALAAATALAVGLGVVIGQLNPALAIWITPGSVARTGAGALLVGVVGAILPIRRVLRVDPAASFRRPT